MLGRIFHIQCASTAGRSFRGLLGILLLIFLSSPSSAQEKGWEIEWNDILAAAKREGKVVISAPPNPELRRELPARFQARFGIPVEYLGGRSSEIAARLRSERQAGHYTLDAVVGGIDTMANIFYPEKMLDPLKPVLILPEVTDPQKWKKGKLWFLDPEEKYVLRILNYVVSNFHVNTQHVKPTEFRSYKAFLDPKWKGKISVWDPTVPGRGMGLVSQLYAQFGEEFVRQFYIDQKPGVSRDGRQISDWLARGTYPISLSADDEQVQRLQREGFPITVLATPHDARGFVASGFGTLGLINRAPHPNAARLFVNWLASREGLELYGRGLAAATTRRDIEESFVAQENIPRPGVDYFDNSEWNWVVTEKERIRVRVAELLKLR